MSQNYEEFLETAIEAAKKAGSLISESFRGEKNVSFKGKTDLVTEVDRNCEEVIIQLLKEKYPDHKFLGEESVSQGLLENTLSDDHTWIIDPIDGTTNFVSGFQFVCVSIALAINKEVVVGVVYNPIMNELFHAIKGKGSYLNNTPLKIKNTSQLKDAFVATGFPYKRDDETLDRVLGTLKIVLQNCRAIRRAGSAALDICYVAKGVFDIYYEETVNSWDIAAGILILQEAGGYVAHMHLDKEFDLCGGHVIVGYEPLVKELKTKINPIQ